jgi:ArsR family transcriptional regulator, arsenate/arsenite/antimonite-responsive transcriptional repressor
MVVEVDKRVAQVFAALADANRLRIIAVLTSHCQSVNEIARQAGLPQPLVSHHLRVLRERGLARADRRGGSTFY